MLPYENVTELPLVVLVGVYEAASQSGGTNYSGFDTTSNWTTWGSSITGNITNSENTWYKYDIVISASSAFAYIGPASNSLATLGTQTYSSAFSVSNNGTYLGLVGDGGGGVSYLNTIIVRAYPPNATMPTDSFGSVTSLTVSFHKILLIM